MEKKQSKSSSKRPSYSARKRKFRGNQYTAEKNSNFASTSAAKLKRAGDTSFDVHVDPTVNYCIIQFGLIFGSLQQIVKCKECNSDVQFTKYGQRGLGFKLSVRCSCKETYINSCPMIDNAFEVNRRFVFAMRMLGIGIHGIKNFCGLMDLGQGLSLSAYYAVIGNIGIAVKTVFDVAMTKAANEEKAKNLEAGNPSAELTVSGDGSWAKRGFTSLLGIVSLVGKYSNKILDVVVKSSTCKACEKWKGEEKTIEYEAWFEEHQMECDSNHNGSAGKMEVDGVLELFRASEDRHSVKYAYYIGDGDTKTFKALLDEKPYGDDLIVKKKECVLHVKKRLYRRAQEAKKQQIQMKKAKKLFESGKGKKTKNPKKKISSTPRKVEFTNKLIKDLSVYYELAVRRHPSSVDDMRKEIWATFYHKISTDEVPQHSNCPAGPESWCEWRKNEATGSLENYHHPPPLSDDVQILLKPIYQDLTSDELLERCLGANTQNNNESFNSCVWHLAPKHIFCGKKILEIATYSAACTFNEGFQPLLKIMETMGVSIGPGAATFAQRQNDARLIAANHRSTSASREARIARRNEKSSAFEAYEEAEGILYEAGIAD